MRENTLKRVFRWPPQERNSSTLLLLLTSCPDSWCVWGPQDVCVFQWWPKPAKYLLGHTFHLWTFSAPSFPFIFSAALSLSRAVFYHPFFPPPHAPLSPRPPSYSLPVSPLSVDISTSETKQTESCVSGLVTLRALPGRRSCIFVSPPSSTFSTFLRRAPVPLACSGLTSRPCGTTAKQDACPPGTETCPP